MNNTTSTVLVVDDETSIRESFKLIFTGRYNLVQAASGEGAVKQIVDHSVDVAYLDIRMPGMDGIETLKRLKEISPQTQVVMVTAVNDVQRASEAVKLGAFNYVVKPFDVNFLLDLTEKLIIRKGMLSVFGGIRSECPSPFIRGMGKVEKIAASNDWVLITGEPGVEKEWLARFIHQQSKEVKPFMVFNVNGKSAGFIESKLFGQVGGETVADIRREPGLVEEAGTIFIDNIDLLPKRLQNKLVEVTARLIGGTSEKEITFENGLKSKLLQMINIPSLRERAAGISEIIDYFFNKSKALHGGIVKEISKEAKDLFMSYSWPGNVEELSVTIDKLVLVGENPVINIDDLPLHLLISSADVIALPFEEVFTDFEKRFIKQLIEKNDGDLLKTAQMLGIQPYILETKI
ncbi:hypothetical protein A3J90_01075 [candidate division WOR-1 bacterium RIFOXYC2_FULL_37_10]|uniref:Fis family transcriptional regulator n=1 Tax=candidate division WOR-1 bacterium RIFOXYB2_FULL_37_13 TaxID=1802579 RepID=A0A1F4STP4_UNCSA|nr:MAG: hypothetical protein A2246_04315 [candidate division WOR-1 bacterium RIFOXYA2_FULL_37_7]OGC23801.1 MAG: hypothetical protein A2310_04200 [candidate division WOR-1 bacterium RIFOXYB2_FULL_37_13]OGC33297.1 MAG: hypothetical protein A3J90_01075 [candidate division WOR-1 bacterium RIFOXYC2_FULL_37_10]